MTFSAFEQIYSATCSLLPAHLNTPEAKAMLVAIALQESRFQYRRQIGGPARGFWQFEHGGGVRGTLNHKVTKPLIRSVLDALAYDHEPLTSYTAIEHNDILACAFARLLLFTIPEPLPMIGEAEEGWRQYIAAWRPGKPHRATWDAFYAQAWA